MLGALGIGNIDEAEAKKGKRRRRRRRTTNTYIVAGNNITFNPNVVGADCTGNPTVCTNAGLTCVGIVCVITDVNSPTPCTSGTDCSTGFCDPNTGQCATCPTTSVCGSGDAAVCCTVGTFCQNATTGTCAITL